MFTDLPLPWIVAVFLIAGAVTGVAGVRMVRIVDRLADATGIGEAIAGGIMLGAATSLGGTVTSISTAYSGATDLAISNAIGGIAVQTAFLGIADLAYRRANLEHAAASVENLLQAALLVSMLSIPLVASSVPAVTVFGVDLFSFVILAFYIFANWMVLQAKRAPMWYPRRSRETQNEAEEGGEDRSSIPRLVAAFIPLALLSGGAGYILGDAGIILSDRTGISQTAVGGVMTSVMTSIPELVTSVAAVRRGALNLAVGGIIGGNVFDVLFLVLGDIAYRDGSLYHAFTDTHRFAVAISIWMTGILLLGLLKRDRSGPAGVGFESVGIMALYAFAAFIFATG